MHSGAIPIGSSERFAMPVNGYSIFFCCSFEKITSNPHLVTGCLCAFREDLEFPLSCSYFGVNTLYIDSCFKTHVEMFFNDVTTESILCANGTIVLSLR